MENTSTCPVCMNRDIINIGGSCKKRRYEEQGFYTFNCDMCGKFRIAKQLHDKMIIERLDFLSDYNRSLLSHKISIFSQEEEFIFIDFNFIEDFIKNDKLPNPAVQARNIIKYIGDYIRDHGDVISTFPLNYPSKIGSINRKFSISLTRELIDNNKIRSDYEKSTIRGEPKNISLTLKGWDEYEAQKSGRIPLNIGFIAMKFNDSFLDPFVKNVIKPVIKNKIGYSLFDMRDVSQAGVIDNIMRSQIRDSSFVIVDLTHDNSGAYWEAGYAEGLGKPVIYICEEEKFNEAKTHFDTNHCTTILWTKSDHRSFCDDLIATIRRSLNLF